MTEKFTLSDLIMYHYLILVLSDHVLKPKSQKMCESLTLCSFDQKVEQFCYRTTVRLLLLDAWTNIMKTTSSLVFYVSESVD